MNRISRSKSSQIAAALGLLVGGTATANAGQVAVMWVGGPAGDWNVAANWSPAVVPDNNGTDTYMVTATGGVAITIPPGTFTIDGWTLGPTDSIRLAGGATLNVGAGPVTNDGEVIVNSDGAAMPAILNFQVSATLDGTGLVRLNALGSGAQVTSDPGAVVTNSAAHEIRGFGELSAAVDNLGAILADGGELILAGGDKRNNGLISNVPGGGFIVFLDVLVDQFDFSAGGRGKEAFLAVRSRPMPPRMTSSRRRSEAGRLAM